MTAHNEAIITNYSKVKIDHTQQNSNCRSCGDNDGTITYIIGECSKLEQKEYKTIMIRWEKVMH